MKFFASVLLCVQVSAVIGENVPISRSPRNPQIPFCYKVLDPDTGAYTTQCGAYQTNVRTEGLPFMSERMVVYPPPAQSQPPVQLLNSLASRLTEVSANPVNLDPSGQSNIQGSFPHSSDGVNKEPVPKTVDVGEIVDGLFGGQGYYDRPYGRPHGFYGGPHGYYGGPGGYHGRPYGYGGGYYDGGYGPYDDYYKTSQNGQNQVSEADVSGKSAHIGGYHGGYYGGGVYGHHIGPHGYHNGYHGYHHGPFGYGGHFSNHHGHFYRAAESDEVPVTYTSGGYIPYSGYQPKQIPLNPYQYDITSRQFSEILDGAVKGDPAAKADGKLTYNVKIPVEDDVFDPKLRLYPIYNIKCRLEPAEPSSNDITSNADIEEGSAIVSTNPQALKRNYQSKRKVSSEEFWDRLSAIHSKLRNVK